MVKLTTKYLGLTLNSPLIVSSSRLTSTIENLKEAEENGAGAVVLKSLFEEQINHHISTLPTSSGYPEADDYISYYTRSHSVNEFRGKLNWHNYEKPAVFERSQFMKYFSSED